MQRPTLIFYEKGPVGESRTSIYSSYSPKLIESYHLNDLERKAEILDIQSLSAFGRDNYSSEADNIKE